MKKIILSVVALIAVFAPISVVAAYTGTGTGTSVDPYRVYSCQQLLEMKDDVEGYYQLEQDIDCTGVSWDHIGPIDTTGFRGVLDGQGYTISNLTYDSTGGVGLITYANGAVLKNLVLDSFSMTGTGTTGTLAGKIADTLVANVRVIDSTVVSETMTGGLVGISMDSLIRDSSATNIDVAGRDGAAMATNIGGLVGISEYTTYRRVSTSGFVDALVGAALTFRTGGLTGTSTSDVFYDSYSAANVSGFYSVGGLVGNGTSVAGHNTYSSGIVAGAGDVGGLAGAEGLGTWNDSFVVGDINGSASTGALVGNVQGMGNDVTRSNWDVVRTGLNNCIGLDEGLFPTNCDSPVNVANSQPFYYYANTTAAPMNAWDFATVWRLTASFPELQIEPQRVDNVHVVPSSSSFVVNWDEPLDTGGSVITNYDLKFRPSNSNDYTLISNIADSQYTITGLTASTEYTIEIRANNAVGQGVWLGFVAFTTAPLSVPLTLTPATSSTVRSSQFQTVTDDQGSTDTIFIDNTILPNVPATGKNNTSESEKPKTNLLSNPVFVAVVAISTLVGAAWLITAVIRKG